MATRSGNPENTLAGIASALRAGADQVEVDVKVTSTTARSCCSTTTPSNGSGAAPGDVTESDPRFVDWGPALVPTLAEALALVGGTGGAELLIDMDAARWATRRWRWCSRGGRRPSCP